MGGVRRGGVHGETSTLTGCVAGPAAGSDHPRRHTGVPGVA